ncbi:Hypothetical protein NTJ_06008 [Nesidiocoris tenuis]|uniref:Uncharacterized protein n=1 Tax=Nesidiocoris tenuis TaxID=355587 RepID=A0ABN7AP46_9HEMI|nr:Hypothetical protein NTJ_06008 [Nesidiocoris tenuis]
MSEPKETKSESALVFGNPTIRNDQSKERLGNISREFPMLDLLSSTKAKKSADSSTSESVNQRRLSKSRQNVDKVTENYQSAAADGRTTMDQGFSPHSTYRMPPPLVPPERFQWLRPRQVSLGTVEYLAMRFDRLRMEPSRNVLSLVARRTHHSSSRVA